MCHYSVLHTSNHWKYAGFYHLSRLIYLTKLKHCLIYVCTEMISHLRCMIFVSMSVKNQKEFQQEKKTFIYWQLKGEGWTPTPSPNLWLDSYPIPRTQGWRILATGPSKLIRKENKPKLSNWQPHCCAPRMTEQPEQPPKLCAPCSKSLFMLFSPCDSLRANYRKPGNTSLSSESCPSKLSALKGKR